MNPSDRAVLREPEAVCEGSLVYTLLLFTARGEMPWKTFSAGCLTDACERHVYEWEQREFSSPIVLVAPDGLRYSFYDSRRIAREELARSTQTASGCSHTARSDGAKE